jgi:hypothetical protein
LRFNRHSVLLTANHVVADSNDEQIGFFFRPPGTLKRRDWWQDHHPRGKLAPPLGFRILDRFRKPDLDLAALIVSPLLEKAVTVRFYDLVETEKIPRRISSVASIGFPADSKEIVGKNAIAISPTTIWGNIDRGKWQPDGFDRERNLLLSFARAALGKHPGGFSGAGIWHHKKRPRGSVWTPNLGLAGMVTHYYPRKQMLLIVRVEAIIAFLREICP